MNIKVNRHNLKNSQNFHHSLQGLSMDAYTLPLDKSKHEYSVEGCKGLRVIVSTQSKTFLFRFNFDGVKKSLKVGKYPIMSLDEAIEVANGYQRLLAKGINPCAEKERIASIPTLTDFMLQTYLPLAKQNKKSWKDDESRFRNHLQDSIGSELINSISTAVLSDVLLAVKNKERANATVNRTRALMSSIFSLAFERELIDTNPMLRVKKYTEQNQIERYLSDDELERLLDVLENYHKYGIKNQIIVSIVEMLLLTGARKGEVLNLKWTDLDLPKGLWKLNENKSGKPRIIQLNTKTQQIIRTMSRKYDYVFANPVSGKPFNDIRKCFDAILKAANIEKFRIHDLRHNFASMAVNSGYDIYLVQHLLGHASPLTTQRYAHMRQDTLREASEKLSMHIDKARPKALL